MRLFVGLAIPDDVVARLDSTIEQLRTAAPELRWSRATNLHITTKFIGTWPAEKLGELENTLSQIESEAFGLHLSGFGWFPNPHSPRIFWVGAKGGEPLVRLAAATDEAAAGLGIAKEAIPYTPHLTLARVKAGVDLRELRGAVAGIDHPDWGRFRVEEFHLYKSEEGRAGSVYTKLARFPLWSY